MTSVLVLAKRSPATGGGLIQLLPPLAGETVASSRGIEKDGNIPRGEPEGLAELVILRKGVLPREIASVNLEDGSFKINGSRIWPLVGKDNRIYTDHPLRPLWFRRRYEVIAGNEPGAWVKDGRMKETASIYFIGWEGKLLIPEEQQERDVRRLIGYCPEKKLIFFGD